MSDPDWRAVYQAEKAAKVKTMREMAHRLGKPISERQAEKAAEKRMREPMERVIRDRLHEPGHKK